MTASYEFIIRGLSCIFKISGAFEDQGCQIVYLRTKIPSWVYFRGLGMENADIFHVVYLTAIR
jgi:hypothetical protein